ncbi:MAG: hypothetical protein J0M12_00950 [Deltaproteobacteria bacterium]|nr:hypothetical protein [Deltaproteobacteria bacterium]
MSKRFYSKTPMLAIKLADVAHAAARVVQLTARLKFEHAVQVSYKGDLSMKHTTHNSSKSSTKDSYRDSMKGYYFELQRTSGKVAATSFFLHELDEVMTRCMQLESPAREQLFVEEICRMNRQAHLAA